MTRDRLTRLPDEGACDPPSRGTQPEEATCVRDAVAECSYSGSIAAIVAVSVSG